MLLFRDLRPVSNVARATAVSNSGNSTVARRLKPSRATAVSNWIHKLQIHFKSQQNRFVMVWRMFTATAFNSTELNSTSETKSCWSRASQSCYSRVARHSGTVARRLKRALIEVGYIERPFHPKIHRFFTGDFLVHKKSSLNESIFRLWYMIVTMQHGNHKQCWTQRLNIKWYWATLKPVRRARGNFCSLERRNFFTFSVSPTAN